jgi:quinol monooxygenase YgiN
MAQALRLVMRSARTDRGCERSDLYCEPDNPNAFCYEEDWSTVKDMDRQIRSERFTQILSVIETAAEPPVLEFRFFSGTRGLEYAAVVRHGEQKA